MNLCLAGQFATLLLVGPPRDITGGLTGWTGGSPGEQPVPECSDYPGGKRARSKKEKTGRSSKPAILAAVRVTDYFTVFVYSLVVVSLLAQALIMLSLGAF